MLTKDEIIYGTGRKISEFWKMREAYLESSYLFKDFGEAESSIWLPRMFEVARNNGAQITPVASLTDIVKRHKAFRLCIDKNSRTKLALRIEADEVDTDLRSKINTGMNLIGLTPSDCVVLADFCNNDFSDADLVAGVMQGILEELQSIGLWQHIIFQGSNYPVKNPAEPDKYITIPRNEWLAWKQAVEFDENTSKHLIFGDYGADCSEFKFPKLSGGRAIRHYRYATEDSWLVVRGASEGKDSDVMQKVCERILSSGQFAGREFSSADDYIYQTAKRLDGPGNASTWREINTAHHITRVVQGIGAVKGYSFTKTTVEDETRQIEMIV